MNKLKQEDRHTPKRNITNLQDPKQDPEIREATLEVELEVTKGAFQGTQGLHICRRSEAPLDTYHTNGGIVASRMDTKDFPLNRRKINSQLSN